jgi:hypothetical protein
MQQLKEGNTMYDSEMQKPRDPQQDEDFDSGKVKQPVNQTYEKAAETLSNTYEQALSYGRENPGKLTLIAFGAGIAIGILLSSTGERNRKKSIAEPVLNELSKIALEFFK